MGEIRDIRSGYVKEYGPRIKDLNQQIQVAEQVMESLSIALVDAQSGANHKAEAVIRQQLREVRQAMFELIKERDSLQSKLPPGTII